VLHLVVRRVYRGTVGFRRLREREVECVEDEEVYL
jgi:hypothetical protein